MNLALLEPVPEQSETTISPPARALQHVRILHVINGEHYSGAERVQDLLAASLPALGFEVGFACVKPGRFPQARRYREARLYELPMHSRFDRGCGRRLAQLVKDENYSLIHAHTPRSLMVGGQAAKLSGVPLIYHVHSPAGRDSTRWLRNMANVWLERRTAHRAARLIAVSPSVRRYMIEQGFLASHVSCVPNGVPRINVPPRQAPPESWTLGMTALFRPRKGIEVLLQALAEVRQRGCDVRLRAIGPFESREYEAKVLQLVGRLDLAAAIDWTGFVTDIPSELGKTDALVLPSLFGEGLPMVVLEAMAAGVPVIASNVEGVPEAICDGREGLLVEPGQAGSMAAAIQDLVGGRHDYAGLSAAAQARHAAHFSTEIMAGRVAELYREVLGG
jgi:glycosyltransferase involved in cell wall biosynthesis